MCPKTLLLSMYIYIYVYGWRINYYYYYYGEIHWFRIERRKNKRNSIAFEKIPVSLRSHPLLE